MFVGKCFECVSACMGMEPGGDICVCLEICGEWAYNLFVR
jgi:hypothetical protein